LRHPDRPREISVFPLDISYHGCPRNSNIQNHKGKAKAHQIKQVLLAIEKLEVEHAT